MDARLYWQANECGERGYRVLAHFLAKGHSIGHAECLAVKRRRDLGDAR